ncbi:MAG: glycosyltransferase [Lepagella sp.]
MKRILFSTQGYPGDEYTEKSFVDPQLRSMLKWADEVVLLPTDPKPCLRRYEESLPPGVSVDRSMASDPVLHSKLRRIFYLFHPFVWKAIRRMRHEPRGWKQWGKGVLTAINTVVTSRIIKRVTRRHNMTPEDTIFFSLWTLEASYGMAHLAGKEGWKVVTRAHSYDLFDIEPVVFRSQSLRDLLFENIYKVICISEEGREYLSQRYPRHRDRFITIYLGSTRTHTPLSRQDREAARQAVSQSAGIDTITFASAIRLESIKQPLLILKTLDALSGLLPDKQIVWHVMGTGTLMESMERAVANLTSPNLKVILHGVMDNQEIQKLYATTPPDWFILMSCREGVPVCIGEAMSYGIPVISTDVGQVGELVTPETGILLHPGKGKPEDTVAAEYAQIIAQEISHPDKVSEKGEKALTRWEETFNSNRLTNQVSNLLKQYNTP